MRTFINLTPHAIVLNDGTIFEPSGTIARVSSTLTSVSDGMFKQVFGQIIDLPKPKADTLLIVSAIVFSATDREDIIAPATSHPDVVRNDKGHIVSVPGFICK
jgi:hypothetical protein